MNENISRFDTLKLATQYWNGDEEATKIIIIIFLIAFVILLLGGLFLQKFLQRRNVRLFFEKYAKSKGLSDKEIKILWSYAKKMERDPILVLEFKAPFEKVIDLYLKEDPDPDEKLAQNMRKKLDFVIQSPYIPIVTTKDIEVFQNAKMIFQNNKSINIALYDKDEYFMYWLDIDNNLPLEIKPGDIVKIMFIRPEDGIYTVTLPIEEIQKEQGKTLIKLPHTFNLHRTQRREFPRVKTNLNAQIIIKNNNEQTVVNAKLDDISAGGAKVCFEKKEENSFYKNLRFSDEILIRFNLLNQDIELILKILDKDIKQNTICIRGLFPKVDDSTKELIMDFVQKEILKAAQIKKG